MPKSVSEASLSSFVSPVSPKCMHANSSLNLLQNVAVSSIFIVSYIFKLVGGGGGGEAGGNKLILHNMNPSKEKKLTEQRLSTKM